VEFEKRFGMAAPPLAIEDVFSKGILRERAYTGRDNRDDK